MQEKNLFLDKIILFITKLEEYKLQVVCGAEIEFYLLNIPEKVRADQLIIEIEKSLNKKIEKEKGLLQYELITEPQNILQLLEELHLLKTKLLSFPEVSLKPKPFLNDYGSALHLHISLWRDGVNLFNQGDTIEENQLLVESLAGILEILNPSLYLITGDDPEEFLRLNNPLLSPSHLSWGKNNRTATIRIPDSPPHNRNRRIEFRLASAQTNPNLVVLFLLTGILYGIKKEIINLQPCLYGLSQDPQYNLEKLFNLEEAKKAFSFWEIFKELCKDT
jgi:glutamine synthetase